MIHNVQGCPRFARIAECSTCVHDNSGTPTIPERKRVNDRLARPPNLPTTQNGYLPIIRLEDHRLKQARCISDRFQVFRTEFYSEGK